MFGRDVRELRPLAVNIQRDHIVPRSDRNGVAADSLYLTRIAHSKLLCLNDVAQSVEPTCVLGVNFCLCVQRVNPVINLGIV